MSRDETHGGGNWSFTKCLWSPSKSQKGTKWAFWENLLRVQCNDVVLHLRGKGAKAAFVGFSIADANGFETSGRPPEAGQWDYSKTFYYVPLREFTPFIKPVSLYNVFSINDNHLRSYFDSNKLKQYKKNLFFVVQAGRLQCLNGAYLSEVDEELAKLLLVENDIASENNEHVTSTVNTNEQFRNLLVRIGQRKFSENVRSNYGNRCCFPECSIAEDKFLIGAHIARWSDDQNLRGATSNGLSLCLMHDKAFEIGLFTLSFDFRVWVNQQRLKASDWASKNLLPFHGKMIRIGKINPSEEALLQHWERINCIPMF